MCVCLCVCVCEGGGGGGWMGARGGGVTGGDGIIPVLPVTGLASLN